MRQRFVWYIYNKNGDGLGVIRTRKKSKRTAYRKAKLKWKTTYYPYVKLHYVESRRGKKSL